MVKIWFGLLDLLTAEDRFGLSYLQLPLPQRMDLAFLLTVPHRK